jgi:transcriptional regulator with XRE-family HTH domain
MRSRGRPPKFVGERRYPNRLRELRARLGQPQQTVAAAAGISLAYYGALERGDKRINADTAQRLQRALHCAVGDLLAGAAAPAVPLRYAIAAAESEARPAAFDLPEPWEWLPAGRLAEPQDCVAAEIADDSADLDFARGTVLFLRPIAALAAPLQLGTRIVCRFFLDPVSADDAPQTHEILCGILDQNIFGDLVLVTRSRNRLVPRNAPIQAAPPARGGLAEASLALRRPGGTIAYAPRAGDAAEILGLIVYAAGPA